MIQKRYVLLGIIGFFLYGLFIHEPDINESDAKKFLSIVETNDNVDIGIADVIKIQEGNDQATIKVADVVKIQEDGGQSAINVLGMGGELDMKEVEPTEDNNIEKTEVSISSDNPLMLRAGDIIEEENNVSIEGIGIGELYELNGQNLQVEGIKNVIHVKGNCGHISVEGIACIVRIDGSVNSVSIEGIGNRVYVDGALVSDKVKKEGILNFVSFESSLDK